MGLGRAFEKNSGDVIWEKNRGRNNVEALNGAIYGN